MQFQPKVEKRRHFSRFFHRSNGGVDDIYVHDPNHHDDARVHDRHTIRLQHNRSIHIDRGENTLNNKSSSHSSTKLRVKRCITMDSGAGNSVMPRRMVIKKDEIRESEGSKN